VAAARARCPAARPQAFRLADGAYKAIDAGDLPRAEAYALRALQIQPGSEQLGLLLVDVYRREGKVDDADALLESLSTRFPNSAAVLAQLGYLAQRQMRYDVACRDFSAAVAGGKWSAEQQRNLRLAWSDSALAAAVRMKRASRSRRSPMKNPR
jgi:tetratricopeptide (TPR) repeat protein